MEYVLLETAGFALIAFTAFAATKYFKLQPIDKSFNANTNTLYFVAIPTVIYLLSRVYFGITFYLTNILCKKYPNLKGEILKQF